MTRPVSTTVIGIACALSASLAFALNDMAIKFLSGGYPLHQVILLRSMIGMTIVLTMVVWLRESTTLRTHNIGLHLLRAVLVVSSNLLFYAALSVMPIADATAIFFVSPLVIALLSVVFLSERVGPHRWGAIIAGLIGAVVMIRPGTDAFTPVALLPLMAAICYASMQVTTRRMGLAESALAMTFYTQLAFLTFSIGMGISVGDGRYDPGEGPMSFLLRAWIWPQPQDWPFLALAGLGSALGGLAISQAYRLCEAALVAPMEYSAMPMAIVSGLLIFGEWPDGVAWIGIALILAAGLYLVYRETRASRK